MYISQLRTDLFRSVTQKNSNYSTPVFTSGVRHSSDVDTFFRVNVATKGFDTKVLTGSVHNASFNLTADKSKIVGNIGEKEVEIDIVMTDKIYKDTTIKGRVGDKQVNLKRYYGRFRADDKISGNFGAESVNINKIPKIVSSRNEDIVGDGVNMTLLLKDAKPFELSCVKKFFGNYEKDPEFLPILAALYNIY